MQQLIALQMIDTVEQRSKKCRTLVHGHQQRKQQPLPRIELDTPTQEQQIKTPKVEDPTFWTKCTKCNMRYKCYMNVLGSSIRCGHCKEVFVADNFPLNTNLSSTIASCTQTGSISSHGLISPLLLPKDEFGSNVGVDSQKTENHGVKNQGNEIEGKQSTRRTALTKVELVYQNFSSKQSVANSGPSDELFKQGLQTMIRGFFSYARGANAEQQQLRALMLYGKIILRNFADLGITDPGLGALLEKLEQQAADVISHQCSDLDSSSAHDLLVDLVEQADYETLEALAVMASTDEEVMDCTRQVEEAEASLAEAKKTEEMAKRARIQAEGELANKRHQLTMSEASRTKARHALEEKQDGLAMAKEMVSKSQEEMQMHMEALKQSKAKWRSLCEEAPGFDELCPLNITSLLGS